MALAICRIFYSDHSSFAALLSMALAICRIFHSGHSSFAALSIVITRHLPHIALCNRIKIFVAHSSFAAFSIVATRHLPHYSL
jgi:hypothetical protein